MLSEYVSLLHHFRYNVLYLVFILFLSEVDVAGYLIVEKLSDKAYLVHKLAFKYYI